MSNGRDVTDLLRQVDATEGWQVLPTLKGRAEVIGPEGQRFLVHLTPSDHRSIKNVRARLRRSGWHAPVNGKRPKETTTTTTEQEPDMIQPTARPEGVPDFGLRWQLAPDGPPPSGHPGRLEVPAVIGVYLDHEQIEAAAQPVLFDEVDPPVVMTLAAPAPEPKHTEGGMRSSAKLRATRFDDLVDEAPPPKARPAVEQTRAHAEALVLDLVTEAPGRWKKLPDQTTPNAAGYLRDAGKVLGVEVQTRFVKVSVDGPSIGWLYVRANETKGA